MAQKINRVAVVGGAGYLGRILCVHLVELGFEVASIDAHWFGAKPLRPLRGNPSFSSVKIDVPHSYEELPLLLGCQSVIWVASSPASPACQIAVAFHST